MAGHGRRGGHVWTRATETGPAVNQDAREGQAPQYLVELLAPLVVGIEQLSYL